MRCILCSRGRAAERDSHTKRRWMVALASSILPSIIIIINLSTSVFTSANRLAATLLTHHDSNDFNLAMQEKSSLRTLGVLSEFSRSSALDQPTDRRVSAPAVRERSKPLAVRQDSSPTSHPPRLSYQGSVVCLDLLNFRKDFHITVLRSERLKCKKV